MQARQNANGQYVRDVEATKKIQGSQFIKIIKGIAESKLYGYTLIEINPTTDPITGKLNDVNPLIKFIFSQNHSNHSLFSL